MSETSCEMITRALHARDPSAMVFAGHAVMALDELRATLTARESELAEAQRRVAELEGKLGQSTNYVADDELYPHVVWFANGRTVSIASGGHLEIGMGGRLAAAKGDVSDEP